jgi:hypothetical protein
MCDSVVAAALLICDWIAMDAVKATEVPPDITASEPRADVDCGRTEIGWLWTSHFNVPSH